MNEPMDGGMDDPEPVFAFKIVDFFRFWLTSSSLSARNTSFHFQFDSIYVIVNPVFRSCPSHWLGRLHPISFRFVVEPVPFSAHPAAPAFIAHPRTLLREGRERGEGEGGFGVRTRLEGGRM